MLNTHEAAAALKITHSRVLQLINQGKLPAKKMGRDWFLTKKDVAEYKRGVPGRPAKKEG